jgi:protein-L-isoaspartate(D-aspartate) O-methyltransferase
MTSSSLILLILVLLWFEALPPLEHDTQQATEFSSVQESDFARMRVNMVRDQIAAREIEDSSVLSAMKRVKRHTFVSKDLAGQAYADRPLPIGYGQTISQPYIVALMTDLLQLQRADRVSIPSSQWRSSMNSLVLPGSGCAGSVTTTSKFETPMGITAGPKANRLMLSS